MTADIVTTDMDRIAPIAMRDRIAVLDVLRGLAILLIFLMNIPYMGNLADVTPYAIGWTPADQAAWWFQRVLLDGTQRGLLQLLFGAGMMIMTARAMTPDGPVGLADAYYRRNIWLIVFGLIHAFGLLWYGEILFTYGCAALFLFPLRMVGPKALFGWGAALLLGVTVLMGGGQYNDRTQLLHDMPAVRTALAAHKPLTDEQQATQKSWQELQEARTATGKANDKERRAHHGGFAAYYAYATGEWLSWAPLQPVFVVEALATMMIGAAMFKWRVIQGGRSHTFYLQMMLSCYLLGFALRWWEAHDIVSMTIEPKLSWLVYEPARLLMTLGHMAAVNLIVATAFGARLLSPFEAVGRVPLTVYVGQSILGMWVLFSPFGLGLWGTMSWAALTLLAFAIMAAQVIGANLLLRYLENGPLEWAWKGLAYVRWQPFFKRPPGLKAPAIVIDGRAGAQTSATSRP